MKQDGRAAFHRKRRNIRRRAEVLQTQPQQARPTDDNNAVSKYLIFDIVFTPRKAPNR
jgi:hypothetical protein